MRSAVAVRNVVARGAKGKAFARFCPKGKCDCPDSLWMYDRFQARLRERTKVGAATRLVGVSDGVRGKQMSRSDRALHDRAGTWATVA
jgi:hypothetical protein